VDIPLGADSADTCEEARVLISAATDDELRGDEHGRLEAHLGICPPCRRHADAVATLTRAIRLRPAQVELGFVTRLMNRSRDARLGRGGWLRPALAWCGLVIAILSVRPLVLADVDGATTHVARHVGASSLALAVGLLYAAWRPHRAFGLLPLVGALLATTLLSTLLDTLDGSRSVVSEAVHIVEMVGLVLLWMVAGSPGWERLAEAIRSVKRLAGAARPTN
jgi:predicted anti-sigma-YlaC factor YlaD